jgi:hypothetical protein
MSDGVESDGPTNDTLIAALRDYPQNPAIAIENLQPAKEDRRAWALLAWMLVQQGRPAEAVPLVRELLTDGGGVAYLPLYLGQQLLGQADAALRSEGVRMLRHFADDPVSFDPFSHAQQLVQQGDTEAALQMLSTGVRRPPAPEREAWQQLLADARMQLGEVRAAVTSAATERDRALEAIAAAREDVDRGRQDLLRLVEEVGGLAGIAGAKVQADDYGKRADKIERRANILTVTAVLLGTVIAVGALLLAIGAANAKDPLETALEKVPISIPLLLLNLYIGGLARAFRQEAVQLRHIELQIRTANPFLGALDEDRRKAVLAMLALRFFPGQPLPVPSDTSEPPDVAAALGTLLAAPKAPAQPGPAGEASGSTAAAPASEQADSEAA